MTLMACIGTMPVGCQQPSPGLKERQDLRDSWYPGIGTSENTAVEHPRSVAVVEGPAPLVYQAQQPGVAHVMDATTGAELASTSVLRGTILRVDQSTGVFANDNRLRPGPMPPGHGYTITMDLEPSDGWRGGLIQTTPPDVSGKQPAKSPEQ